MLHSLIITLMVTYKAFLGGLLLGVVPNQNLDLDDSVNNLYKLQEHEDQKELNYKITKDLSLLAPVIDAKGVLAVDLGTDKILYSKDAYKRKQIASITKLMTAVLVMEKTDLNKTVIIPSDIYNVIGSKINLSAGEKLSVEDLLKAMLIHSANDAAFALADSIGGGQTEFVELMNQKAKDLGLINTNFSNSIGLDNTKNYSTSFEVYLIVKEFLKYPKLREIVAIQSTEIETLSKKKYKLENTNKNLGSFLKIIGVKTGTTDLAGESLVNLLEISPGKEVVMVLLDSPRRFSEAKILGDWCKRAYQWIDK